ncbi:MAG TPA: RNA polymerase sigma factor [Solirubrobacteraceae bacterium]|nr:RNA polymerase sigma factor [Solirubrobacteraceae bacterium]
MTDATSGAGARRLDPRGVGDHLDRLFRAAWALAGNRDDAEELVQETYARVLAKPRWLRGDDDLGYLLRALRNTHLDRVRGARRRPAEVPLDGQPEPRDRVATREPHAALEAADLFAVIAALPRPFREALVAIDVAGLSYREAARAFRVREATITTRLHRARARVAAELRESAPAPAPISGGDHG